MSLILFSILLVDNLSECELPLIEILINLVINFVLELSKIILGIFLGLIIRISFIIL